MLDRYTEKRIGMALRAGAVGAMLALLLSGCAATTTGSDGAVAGRKVKEESFASVYLRINERAPTRRRLFREQHLQNDPKGRIELLDRFWDFPDQPQSVAPWPIVYADLHTTGDARAIETAALIRETYLHE
jgi:hypothetical protein